MRTRSPLHVPAIGDAATHKLPRESVPVMVRPYTDYAEPDEADRSNDNSRNTLCGIVRHSTLWLKPQLVGQFEFVEWTSDGHLRHRNVSWKIKEGEGISIGVASRGGRQR